MYQKLAFLTHAQFGYFKIFLPFRICVKPVLGWFWSPKNCYFDHLAALNFEFLTIVDIFQCEIPQKPKFKASEMDKMSFFDLLESTKIDFT